MNIGQTLKRIRKSKQFSQLELAKVTGLTQAQISWVERGKSDPNHPTIYSLCRGLEYPVPFLYLASFNTSNLSAEKKVLFDAGVELIEKSLQND